MPAGRIDQRVVDRLGQLVRDEEAQPEIAYQRTNAHRMAHVNHRLHQFGSICFGLTVLLVLQAAINIAVVIGALPTKGLALPFISYGGTNMLAALTVVGILINIGRHAEEIEFDAHAQMVRNAAQRI